MGFRIFETSSGKKAFLGKNAENNDELVSKFNGKTNIIMHTAKPGSPFCVFEKIKVSKKDIQEAAIACSSRSQDWRDNKSDVAIHIFTGKDVYKEKGIKAGTWCLRGKPKKIIVKKKEIQEFLEKQ